MRSSCVSVVESDASNEPPFVETKRRYFDAPSTFDHWNVTGDFTSVAPFAGESNVVAAFLQSVPFETVNVERFEIVDGQSPGKIASTSQTTEPAGNGDESCVADVLPTSAIDALPMNA